MILLLLFVKKLNIDIEENLFLIRGGGSFNFNIPLLKLNCWTTISSLNVENLPSILDFATEHGIDHNWAFLSEPDALNVKYKNKFTLRAKEKLSNSSYAVCRNIADKIATNKDNSEQINLYIKKQDYIPATRWSVCPQRSKQL